MNTTTAAQIRLRNTITGKFYANGAWNSFFCDAEVIDKNSPEHIILKHTWSMEFSEEVPEIDDSEKPVKTSDYRGRKSWSYKGRMIYSQARRSGSYPRRVETWTEVRIGTESISGSFHDAVKLIDAGKA